MSDHDETPPKPTLPRWFFSAAGVFGSIVIMMAVLGIAYYTSQPKVAVDADVAANRKKMLADVQAAQSDLYNNYSVVDKDKNIFRIPVKEAMAVEAAKLDAATRGLPEAPARLSLAASPAGFTPPAPVPPAATAPAASTAAPVGSATPAGTAAKAAASAAGSAAPAK